MDNLNDQQQPLSCDKLMAIAEILSENVVTTQRELDHVLTSDEIHQIIKLMPMILLTKKDCVFINLHEFLFTPGVLEAFLLSAEPLDEEPIVSEPIAIASIQPEDLDRKSVGGQPAITTKFPETADIASDFVKQNSFAAQIRRRSNTGSTSSAGVSVSQIR